MPEIGGGFFTRDIKKTLRKNETTLTQKETWNETRHHATLFHVRLANEIDETDDRIREREKERESERYCERKKTCVHAALCTHFLSFKYSNCRVCRKNIMIFFACVLFLLLLFGFFALLFPVDFSMCKNRLILINLQCTIFYCFFPFSFSHFLNIFIAVILFGAEFFRFY